MEIWKSVRGFEGLYEVSNLGRVRSLDRSVKQSNRWGPMESTYRGRLLSTSVAASGYLQVTLSKQGVAYQRHVHVLVAGEFVGPQPAAFLVLHRDGDRLNCADDNLYYGTVKQNSADSIRHGTVARGERQGAAKLTEAAVIEIRETAHRVPYRVLAAKFGVNRSAVGMAARGKSWRHVEKNKKVG